MRTAGNGRPETGTVLLLVGTTKRLMGVAVRVPGPLRGFTGGKGEIEIEGSPRTVGETLTALWALHPAVSGGQRPPATTS